MKIRLRFISVDAPNLPPAGDDGCAVMDVADGLSVDRALASLKLPNGSTYLTLVNEDTVPIAQRSGWTLQDDDLLTVFIPIKGG